MKPKEVAEAIKAENVIDMAFTFTAMGRVFEAQSKEKIISMLKELFLKIDSSTNPERYSELHNVFCTKFISTIKTAKKNLKNGAVKESRSASYGQAAKVLDIAIKVYVYYCGFPSKDISNDVSKILFGAVDTPILTHLKKKYPKPGVKANTIENINKSEYEVLQSLLCKEISEAFSDEILPVQYDDIMWNTLNRNKA